MFFFSQGAAHVRFRITCERYRITNAVKLSPKGESKKKAYSGTLEPTLMEIAREPLEKQGQTKTCRTDQRSGQRRSSSGELFCHIYIILYKIHSVKSAKIDKYL